MEFQLYTCKIGKDLERSYAVYTRSLGPPESNTIESAFIRILLENDWCFYYVYKNNKDTEFLPRVSPSSTKGVGVNKNGQNIFFKIFDFPFVY